ncbi:hypothetical protein D3C84_643240 [compost metagenome]
MIERGHSVVFPLRDKKQAEPGADQRAESHQAFQRPFQVQARHHGVTDNLKTAGMKMAVGFQTDVRIAAGLRRQLPKPIDHPSLARCSRGVRNVQIQSSLLTKVGDIQSFR